MRKIIQSIWFHVFISIIIIILAIMFMRYLNWLDGEIYYFDLLSQVYRLQGNIKKYNYYHDLFNFFLKLTDTYLFFVIFLINSLVNNIKRLHYNPFKNIPRITHDLKINKKIEVFASLLFLIIYLIYLNIQATSYSKMTDIIVLSGILFIIAIPLSIVQNKTSHHVYKRIKNIKENQSENISTKEYEIPNHSQFNKIYKIIMSFTVATLLSLFILSGFKFSKFYEPVPHKIIITDDITLLKHKHEPFCEINSTFHCYSVYDYFMSQYTVTKIIIKTEDTFLVNKLLTEQYIMKIRYNHGDYQLTTDNFVYSDDELIITTDMIIKHANHSFSISILEEIDGKYDYVHFESIDEYQIILEKIDN